MKVMSSLKTLNTPGDSRDAGYIQLRDGKEPKTLGSSLGLGS